VRLSIYDMLEVAYLYEPVGAPMGEREVRGARVIFRGAEEGELESLVLSERRLLVYVTTPQDLWRRRDAWENIFQQSALQHSHVHIVLVEDPLRPATVKLRKRIAHLSWNKSVVVDLRAPYTLNQFVLELNKACTQVFLEANQSVYQAVLDLRDAEAKGIHEIGLAMMVGQSSLDELLRLVLEKAIDLSFADAGFLLLRENLLAEPLQSENDVKFLRKMGNKFSQKYRICKSQNVKLGSAIFDPQRSEFTSVVVNRGDAISWNKGTVPIYHSVGDMSFPSVDLSMPELEFDQRSYDVKSFCVFPLRTPACEVVGFILLVNRRIGSDLFCDNKLDIESNVIGFSSHDLNVLGALANQAGVSIDHARLYRDMKNLFESFVQASVYAIESRDPTTKGHSERVAVMTVGLAEALNRVTSGPYGNVNFNPSQLYEIKYAALLHDFGKIGVQEQVLQKEKKLYPHEISQIRSRFGVMEARLRLNLLEAYVEGLMKRGEAPTQETLTRMKFEMDKLAKEFSELWAIVSDANEPNVVNQDAFQKIASIAGQKILVGTEEISVLTESEIKKLSIRRGSLSADERKEIENHVNYSYRFLQQIPWSNDLANVPDIVYAHHERLDGSGYPRGLVDTRDEIPIQAKIMAITDIYDALVASDRPYKRALPVERALSILEAEVRDGKLDKHLFEVFVESKIADLVASFAPAVKGAA
jgi:HD-GYP domain-containing protein (c-di-GMP phosphodiesterase class II)